MARLLGVLCFALLAATAAGTQYKVGGSGDWNPLDTMSYNQWAQHTRFKVGDSLLFVYPAQKDSVLQVDKAAYDNCNTTTYIQKYDDGNTVVKLDRSGAFFFISGNEVNCLRNETMHIVVLADKHKSMPPSPSPASATTPPAPATPAPAPMASSSPPPASATPAPAPMASSSPPPAPEASSSPPPAPESNSPPPAAEGTAEGPAPAAKDSTPPPNGASVKAMGFISSIGAFIGYLLVL